MSLQLPDRTNNPSPTQQRILDESPFTSTFREIAHLQRRGHKRNNFSFVRDEKKICEHGWSHFAERVARNTTIGLQEARLRVKEMRKEPRSIFTRKGADARESEMLLEEPVRKLVGWVNGSEIEGAI
ncbi:unnamed protein product [Sphagnum balticum]